MSVGAGEGNRTLVSSLGSYSFTIKLHPRTPANSRFLPDIFRAYNPPEQTGTSETERRRSPAQVPTLVPCPIRQPRPKATTHNSEAPRNPSPTRCARWLAEHWDAQGMSCFGNVMQDSELDQRPQLAAVLVSDIRLVRIENSGRDVVRRSKTVLVNEIRD